MEEFLEVHGTPGCTMEGSLSDPGGNLEGSWEDKDALGISRNSWRSMESLDVPWRRP